MDLQRPTASAAEIAALPDLGTTDFTAHIHTVCSSLQPETLVHVMRLSLSLQDFGLLDLCGRMLVGCREPFHPGHCERIIMALARDYRITGEELGDYRQSCYEALFAGVRSGEDGERIWEERFGFVFKRKCIDSARKHRTRARRDRAEDEFDETIVPQPDEHRLEDQVLSKIDRDRLLEAVRLLPQPQGTAAMLAWIDGVPIDSATGDSVSNMMGTSAVSVHKHL